MKRILISKKFKLCCLFFFLSSIAYCQTNSNTSGTIPPSPNASSLGKFADTPVGYYTGTPQVNIPLFEITEGDVKLPISLDYHAGGVRVEETASAVGLGWALQAGGVVSRVKRGLVDEQTVGQQPWINGAYAVPTTGDPVTHANYWNLAADGVLDTEPDLFHFNFLGRTGKFFLDNQGIPHLVPFQKLIITPVRASNGTPLSAWTIKAEDGTEYLFSKIEKTKPVTSCNGIIGPSQMEYTSAWYLTEVRPVNTTGIITIEYDNYSTTPSLYEYKTISSSTKVKILSESGTVQDGGAKDSNCETRIIMYDPARVKRIKSSTALVEFVYGAERCDLKGDFMLDEIHHSRKNKDNSYTLIKKFKLNHKYLNGVNLKDITSSCHPTNPIFDPNDYSSRLMLVGVSEVGVNDGIGKEHKFEYYLKNSSGRGLPDRLSYSQDHWGFYNGSSNDSGLERTLIPATSDIPNGAFRQCEASSAKVGSLKAITYPTKGRTEFDYESHDIYNRGGFKFETLTPKTAGLPIRPHLQSFGQVTVSDSFKVKSTKASVLATLSFGFTTDCNAKPCGDTLSVSNPYCQEYFYFEIWKHTGSNGSLHRLYTTDFGLTQYRLDTGVYYHIAHVIPLNIETYKANLCHPYSISLNWLESTTHDVSNFGGLRIKKITDVTPNQQKKTVRIFSYRENGTSSGTAVSYPVYSYDQLDEFRTRFEMNSGTVVQSGSRTSRIFSSSSSQPLGSTQGASVGYSTVTVYYGEDSTSGAIGLNGKTVYKYTDPYRFPDKQSSMGSDDIPSYAMKPNYPFAPMDSQDWLRGLLLESSDYSREGNVYKVKRRVNNLYTYYKNRYDLSSWKVGALKTMYSYVQSPSSPAGVLQSWDLLPAVHRTHAPVPFKMRTGYNEMYQSVEKVYESDTTNFMTTTTDYIYSDDHLQLLEKKVTKSDGKVIRTLTKYAGDFPSALTDTDPASIALAKMKNQNRIAVPIENRTLVDDKLVSGSIIKFKEFQTDKIFPHETYVYRTNTPVASPVQSSITNKQLVFEQFNNGQGFEKDVIFNDYNDKGALISSQKNGSFLVSYIWDYFNTLPIAEVTNASSNDIAYTGFEHDGKGNWTMGTAYNTVEKFTGSLSYNVSASNTISKAGLNSATSYKVSFWARTGVPTINGSAPTAGETINGWTYYERSLSGATSVTIAGTGVIDELRLCPAQAAMTTYTYEPGRGIISTCDLNSVPTFYQYDELNRLSIIKDHKGSILKRYEYNYQVE